MQVMVLTHLRSAYGWIGAQAHRPYAPYLLAILFYIEALFFFPTEPILAIYSAERKELASFFATIATLASVLGGITSYLIGLYIWQTVGPSILYHPFVNFFITPERFAHLSALFAHYEWAALLVAGIPPIPYKAVTLAAGFCRLPLIPFILCSCIVRGARFYLIAYTVTYLGTSMKAKFEKHHKFIIMVMVLASVGIIFYRLRTY